MKNVIIIIIAMFFINVYQNIYAETFKSNNKVTIDQIKNLTIEQINLLSKEQLNDLPAINFFIIYFSKNKKLENELKVNPSKFIIGNIEIALNNLKYYYKTPTGMMNPELVEAIKKYQKVNGMPVTGELSLEEYKTLQKNEELVIPEMIQIVYGSNGKPSVTVGLDYVSVEGTWTLLNEVSGSPINISKILCSKETKSCFEANANITRLFGGDVLDIQFTDYTITKWSDDEITAGTTRMCRVTTLIINPKSKAVTSVTRDNSQADEICKNIPKITKPRISILSASFPINEELRKKKNLERLKAYNPEYSNAIKQIVPEMSE